jgi:hypothetical protein
MQLTPQNLSLFVCLFVCFDLCLFIKYIPLVLGTNPPVPTTPIAPVFAAVPAPDGLECGIIVSFSGAAAIGARVYVPTILTTVPTGAVRMLNPQRPVRGGAVEAEAEAALDYSTSTSTAVFTSTSFLGGRTTKNCRSI